MKLCLWGTCDFAQIKQQRAHFRSDRSGLLHHSAFHSANPFCAICSSLRYKLEIWSIIPRDGPEEERKRKATTRPYWSHPTGFESCAALQGVSRGPLSWCGAWQDGLWGHQPHWTWAILHIAWKHRGQFHWSTDLLALNVTGIALVDPNSCMALSFQIASTEVTSK